MKSIAIPAKRPAVAPNGSRGSSPRAVTSVSLKDKVLKLKRDEILRVAGEKFFAQGYTQTSLEDIATTLAIGKPLIYACFENKTALLAEVCTRTSALAADVAAASLKTPGSASHRLAYMVREVSKRIIEGRMFLAVLFREVKHLPKEANKTLSRDFHHFNHSLKKLLEEGVESGEFSVSDPGVVTLAISGMTTWIYSWYRPNGPLTAEQVSEQMVQLALRMVRAKAT